MNDLLGIVGEIAKQGTLALLLVVAVYALQQLFKKYAEVQEKRILEAQANYKIIVELTQAVRELTAAQRGDRMRP